MIPQSRFERPVLFAVAILGCVTSGILYFSPYPTESPSAQSVKYVEKCSLRLARQVLDQRRSLESETSGVMFHVREFNRRIGLCGS